MSMVFYGGAVVGYVAALAISDHISLDKTVHSLWHEPDHQALRHD